LTDGKYFFEKITDFVEKEVTLTKPLLSIGQMIEFLDEMGAKGWSSLICEKAGYLPLDKDNICDRFWEEVKEVLDNG